MRNGQETEGIDEDKVEDVSLITDYMLENSICDVNFFTSYSHCLGFGTYCQPRALGFPVRLYYRRRYVEHHACSG